MQQPRAIELLEFLLPRLADGDNSFPRWPPDVFALMAILLQRSRSYASVLSDWPPSHRGFKTNSRKITVREKYVEEVHKAARTWATKLIPPERLDIYWKSVMEACKTYSLAELPNGGRTAMADALLLLAVADEATLLTGILPHSTEHASIDSHPKLWEARFGLGFGDLQSLCDELSPERAVVLPKKRTPQTGLTIRSFSNHIAAIESPEATARITTRNHLPKTESRAHAINLVLCPWPDRIFPRNVSPADPPKNYLKNMDQDTFGFFTLEASRCDEASLLAYVELTLKEAESKVGRVDGIVFPESALSPEQFKAITLRLTSILYRGFFLAGVFESPASSSTLDAVDQDHKPYGKNYSRFWTLFQKPLDQHKHHRWSLDAGQIRQYQLGSALDTEKRWWEYIELQDRTVQFINLSPWNLMMVPLICEDLARPDPIAGMIRAVGPDLVIALLMDGPQLLRRWSARNAATLSDDPGCAVLTLTSLALVHQSNATQSEPSRVVAMFKDILSGDHEISLPNDATSVILTLTQKNCVEWSADGRRDLASAKHPVLTGVHYGYAKFPNSSNSVKLEVESI